MTWKYLTFVLSALAAAAMSLTAA
ncbi:MAG: hypothetical protein RL693_1163, partial [Verrucomicrobiota bacterium]